MMEEKNTVLQTKLLNLRQQEAALVVQINQAKREFSDINNKVDELMVIVEIQAKVVEHDHI